MFGQKIKKEIVKAIDSLLESQMTIINEVHENDGEITLAIKVKLGELGKKGLNWSAELAFVKERVKVGISGQTDENQLGLFDDKTIDSVTIKHGDRVVEMKRPFKSNQI